MAFFFSLAISLLNNNAYVHFSLRLAQWARAMRRRFKRCSFAYKAYHSLESLSLSHSRLLSLSFICWIPSRSVVLIRLLSFIFSYLFVSFCIRKKSSPLVVNHLTAFFRIFHAIWSSRCSCSRRMSTKCKCCRHAISWLVLQVGM